MTHSKEVVAKVWQHARVMTDLDPETWRQDECGAWIRREHYAREDSEFGWRIVNVSVGGLDSVENLRPLQHANSYDRAGQRAHCKVRADQGNTQGASRVQEPRNRNV
jgi:hypothetical protein